MAVTTGAFGSTSVMVFVVSDGQLFKDTVISEYTPADKPLIVKAPEPFDVIVVGPWLPPFFL